MDKTHLIKLAFALLVAVPVIVVGWDGTRRIVKAYSKRMENEVA